MHQRTQQISAPGPATYGPYATEADARHDAADIYNQARERHSLGLMTLLNTEALLRALDSAGVELGTYDRQIVGWLGGWEPEVVQAVIGWLSRAGAR